jgi:uncharacterized protein (DUF1684 family)
MNINVNMPALTYLDLVSYRREVVKIYGDVRSSTMDPEKRWDSYRRAREALLASHVQSALSIPQKQSFSGLPYYDYDEELRFEIEPVEIPHEMREMQLKRDGLTRLVRFAEIYLKIAGEQQILSLYWILGYGGGIFLPFRDATNGKGTYSGGRYLLDTIKGADLGRVGNSIILDFNYSYNPSCAYNAHWHCPLAPPENRLDLPIQAGEKDYPDPV